MCGLAFITVFTALMGAGKSLFEGIREAKAAMAFDIASMRFKGG